ncbi:MAG: VCBS repeat-containing protein, partial [Gemmataceae bacterium]|nr:VCBS repeat-containing protein [Gemmataceae bacterium]
VVGALCLLINIGTHPDSVTRHADDLGTADRWSRQPPPPGAGTSGPTHPEGLDDRGILVTPLVQRVRAAAEQRIDPHNDGWDSEVFSEAALKQLHELEELLECRQPLTIEHLRELIVEDFSCQPLRPEGLKTAWQGNSLVVRRLLEGAPARTNAAQADAASNADGEQPDAQTAPKAASATVFRGPAGCLAALEALQDACGKDSQPQVHFKLYRVEPRDGQFATVVDYQTAARVAAGAVQQNATWRCVWRQPGADAPPRLASIEVDRYEEIVYSPPDARNSLFSDCTAAAIGSDPCFDQQLKLGLDHWARRIERRYNLVLASRYGLALGDVNGDELDDVFVCQPGGLPKRLFLHNANGTVTDHSAAAGVDWLDLVISALLVDLDNDGDQDVVLGMLSRLVLMENDGRGHFAVKTVLRVTDYDVQSLSAVDYDNDGYLDLFVCVGRKGNDAAPSEAFSVRSAFNFHDARDGGACTLFRSDLGKAPRGTWRFSDVTAAVGLDKDNFRHSLAAAWEDYDNDGDQDLCIANDYGPKQLFRNDGGRFVEVAAEAGAQDLGSGMSVSWADYDRDGWIDLYLGNMFSSAGNRIAYQAKYLAGADHATRATYQRFAKGNTLLRNVGAGKFQEVENAGVEMGRWAWSSLFVDVNNDGWPDVLVANGFITGDDTTDL